MYLDVFTTSVAGQVEISPSSAPRSFPDPSGRLDYCLFVNVYSVISGRDFNTNSSVMCERLYVDVQCIAMNFRYENQEQ